MIVFASAKIQKEDFITDTRISITDFWSCFDENANNYSNYLCYITFAGSIVNDIERYKNKN
jgi:hypothetical protein